MFNKNKLLIGLAKSLLKALLAGLIAGAVVWFLSGQIAKTGKTLYEKKKLSLILSKRTETVLKLTEDFKIVGANDEKIENALPTTDSILEAISVLESVALKNSLVQSLRFGNPTLFSADPDKIPLGGIDYSITINGTATAFTKYLEDFEKLPYFSGISNLNLSGPSDKGWDGNALITAQARLYTKWAQE